MCRPEHWSAYRCRWVGDRRCRPRCPARRQPHRETAKRGAPLRGGELAADVPRRPRGAVDVGRRQTAGDGHLGRASRACGSRRTRTRGWTRRDRRTQPRNCRGARRAPRRCRRRRWSAGGDPVAAGGDTETFTPASGLPLEPVTAPPIPLTAGTASSPSCCCRRHRVRRRRAVVIGEAGAVDLYVARAGSRFRWRRTSTCSRSPADRRSCSCRW